MPESSAPTPHQHLARAFILTGLVCFGFFLAVQTGLLGTALSSDRSYLSYVILLLYGGASIQWLLHSRRMSQARDQLARLESALATEPAPTIAAGPDATVRIGEGASVDGDLAAHLVNVLAKRERVPTAPDTTALMGATADTLATRHAGGHFIADTLLRLGLLGTVVGFILMLAPVAEMEAFDPAAARTLLQNMSGGMAVALYTTLCGLVTSILLKFQYQLLDSAAQDFLNRLAVLTDVHLLRHDTE